MLQLCIFIHRQTSVNSLSTIVKRSKSALPKVHPSQTQLRQQTDSGQLMQTEKNMLQAEIEFWHYMITSRRGTVSEQATERMLHACHLAERKLLKMDKESLISDLKQ